jgi:5'-methylthioadenosine phosphorylase
MPRGNIAIIGGTGFETLPPEIFAERVEVTTRYGTAHLLSLSNNYVEPYKLYFLSRHGETHGLAPHQIDYRANIAALVELDVRYLFATNAVGSLRADLLPGSLVLFDDFLDFTRQRPLTYFAEGETWRHTDFTVPYSPRLRQAVLDAATNLDVTVVPRATYLCCDGPRFESPAEVRLFGQWGADVVGMTGIPEAIFAKEAGLEYAALGIVTNLGAGLAPGPVEHTDVVSAMAASINTVRELLLHASGIVYDEFLRLDA